MIVRQGNVLLISCPMTVDTVGELLAEGAEILNAGNDALELDLGRVEDADSAGISLIFEWLRQAQSQSRQLTFLNLPQSLLSLARLYGVLEMIPQTAAHH